MVVKDRLGEGGRQSRGVQIGGAGARAVIRSVLATGSAAANFGPGGTRVVSRSVFPPGSVSANCARARERVVIMRFFTLN